MDWLHVLILSLIEGLTEFLPISSTGHLILASAFMGIHESSAVQQFNIVVQFGAILAVVALYWKRFLPNFSFYKKIVLGFLPAAFLGLLLKSRIEALLGNVTVVALALICGGIFLIYSDTLWKNQNTKSIDILSHQDVLWIGFLQCLAFIPGVSRAAATILAGRWRGMNQKEAAEFSFFLAVPTLTGAAFLKLFKGWGNLDLTHGKELAVGTVLSFVFAWIAIRFFLSIVSKYGFKHFGYYRIILGTFVLIYFWS